MLWERDDYRFITFSRFNLEFLESDLSRKRVSFAVRESPVAMRRRLTTSQLP